MNILGTGLSGMVGGTVVKILESTHQFRNLSLEVGVDITNPDQVNEIFSQNDAPWVLHFAAKTQVDDAETEKQLGVSSPTWIVNVNATKTIVESCKRYNKKLLHVSTDFVFPGGEQLFTETDSVKPIGWYAETKAEAEKIVSTLEKQALIMRIAFPYGCIPGQKKDFVARIRELLAANKSINAPVDQYITPTFVPDIAAAIDLFIQKNAYGIYHVVGTGSISSYDASLEIAEYFGYNKSLVHKTSVSEYYAGKAPRATKLKISNDKLKREFGLLPLSFSEGIQQLKAAEK